VIASKYGTENIGIAEGVTFSSASSIFFSNIAKAVDIRKSAAGPVIPIANKGDGRRRCSNYKRSSAGNDVGTPSRGSVLNPYAAMKKRPAKLTIPSSSGVLGENQPVATLAAVVDIHKCKPVPGKNDKHAPKDKECAKGKGVQKLIDPSLYQPPVYQHKPDPIIHTLTNKNRPMTSRHMVPVSNLFRPPVANFWRSKFHSFNHVQTELSQLLTYSDDNIVVSAPTGAGKTCIFEMAMGRLFTSDLDKKTQHKQTYDHHHHHQQISNSRKIVYISPSKALCEERYEDWKKRLVEIDSNIECAIVTGDAGTAFQKVAMAHVILTTPEKWDSITRKWTQHMFLIGSVKLLLLDEVHLLGDESRGSCLEAVICRMKTVQRAARAKQVADDEIQNSR